MLMLRNPHSVLAAMRARPGSVRSISVGASKPSEGWERVLREAESSRTPLIQGHWEAAVRPCQPVSFGGLLLPNSGTEGGEFRVLLALDQVTDPQNMGGIFRSAAFFGVSGAVLLRDRQAPLSSVAYDVATGGVEAVPYAEEVNLSRALREARDAGYWILGTSEHAMESKTIPLRQVALDRHWILVVGNEEKGLRQNTLDHCDVVTSVMGRGKIVTSLNVASATTSVLSHLFMGG